MADIIQDEDLVKADLRRQERLENERAPYESTFRDAEALCDPMAAGGFSGQKFGPERNYNFDSTAMDGLDRFDAALGAVTMPKTERWLGLTVYDKDLARMPVVQRWLEHATDRCWDCIYAPHANFGVATSEDRRSLGCYGTGPLWVDEARGRGLFFRGLHMSETFIDVDFRGRVDTVQRKFEQSAREAAQMFGADSLSEKMRAANADPTKCDSHKFQILHVVRPNDQVQPGALDYRGKPIASRYIAVDEKFVLRQGGFHTMPVPVSRNSTAPRQKYGSSPMMKVMGTARGLQEMARTILRAGHKAVDPPILFFDDGDVSKLVTKPGGLNPGMVNEDGRLLAQPLPSGGNHGIAREMQESERSVVKTAFLEDFFKVLTDPGDRMTATQVLEMVAKQGVLVGPFADRYETEKVGVLIERVLDILLRAGQIAPMPPEMVEAGAYPLVFMKNPLARMARAGEAAAFTRWVEIGVQAASAGRPEALDRVDFDAGMVGVGEVLGVRPSWILDDDELAALRQQREQEKQAQEAASVVPAAADASLSLAKANQIASSLGQGGGLG
jgi:hypothetical protein